VKPRGDFTPLKASRSWIFNSL